MNEEPLSIAKAIQLSGEFLKKKGFAQGRLEAELLLCKVLEMNRIQLYLKYDQILTEDQKTRYRELLKKRSAYEPTAYIIGEKEFLSRPFYVDRSVLIPRPETELLVEKTIEVIKKTRNEKNGTTPSEINDSFFVKEENFESKNALKLLEIGVGSGVISISIALEKLNIKIWANDCSEKSLLVAKKNAERHNVLDAIKFFKGDLFEGINEKFDIIVSNPPYVSTKDKDSLSKDILDWEPHTALFAGEDGLDVIQRIIKSASDYLNNGGFLLLEIGYNHSDSVKDLIDSSGLKMIEIAKDLSNIPRVLIAQKVAK